MIQSFLSIAADPGRIRTGLRNRLLKAAYYYGDGSYAFFPRELVMYVNNRCNGRCIMCDIGRQRQESVFSRLLAQTKEDTLSIETCQKLADELKRQRPMINIGGVEPLLRKDIIELVSLFKWRGFPVKLVTNGWNLPEYAEKLVQAGLDQVVISLDGPRTIHDSIRGDGFFDRAVDGIRRLQQARQHSVRKTTIAINTCINHRNYRSLAEFAGTMIREEKVETIRFANWFFISEAASERHNDRFGNLGIATPTNFYETDISTMDTDILWAEIQRIRQRFSEKQVSVFPNFRGIEALKIYYQEPELFLQHQRCLTPWNSATINADGDVIVRNRCIDFVGGNIRKESFNSIWNGPLYREFRRELKKAGLFPACARCCGAF